MCQYTLLHHCEHGYVIKCNKCDHFQIAFGTTAISLNEEQFMQFREVIIERLQESNEDFPQQKSIHIPTIYPSICLVYSQKELKQLHALLESSHFSMEVNKLLVQHSIQSN